MCGGLASYSLRATRYGWVVERAWEDSPTPMRSSATARADASGRTLAASPLFADETWEALRFAERAHRGHVERDGVTPYVRHVADVARLALEAGASSAVVCAAYLHDVVEDEGVTADEIAERFGSEVAELVLAVSDEPQDPETGARRAWMDQKRLTVRGVRDAAPAVVLLKAADLCSNVDSLLAGHARVGRAVWRRYPAGAARHSGYYLALGHALLERLDESVIRDALEARLDGLRRTLAADGIQPRGRFRRKPRGALLA
jgi:guanosine-3',5'-bis(diphosphate) 3'-pyrophosphohydrolase